METTENYYDNFYGDYQLQNSPGKLGFYLGLVKKYLKPDQCVFELGVGKGLFYKKLAEAYENTIGSDVNPEGVEATQQLVPGRQLFLGSYEQIPSQKVNGVVSWDVLEHLPDLDKGLKEIHSRLRPQGYLIGVVPVYDGPLGWLVHRLDKDPTHVTKDGRYFWLDQLQKKGFQVKDWGGINRKLVGQTYIHITQPQLILRTLGTAIYFVAQKD